MDNSKKVILMYDFDKTLSKKYMSEYDFLQDVGIDDSCEFWHYCNNELAKNNNMDNNLAFMLANLIVAQKKGIKLTKKYLNSVGKNITYFDGVIQWFKRINEYGERSGLQIEHFIISSGIQEIIEGSEISKYFTKIFASSYVYDDSGEAFWPRTIVNYTAKTQYIFRIKKNLLDEQFNDVEVNRKINSELTIPYSNMIYFGDGETDIPCMKLVKEKGGHSVCVYSDSERSQKTAKQILSDKRVNLIAKADYSEGSTLDKYVKKIIKNISKKQS